LALPDNFKRKLGELDEQHDSSEFARIFLDKLESELKQISNIENINKKYLEGGKIHRI
jgi:ubiquitin C-terminal hydrolase